jgi:hypothetical protein
VIPWDLARVIRPDCPHWFESGRPATTSSSRFTSLTRLGMAAPDSTASRISPPNPVRDCHKVFDMSSRTNSSDISLSTVSCMRTDCIYRVLNALKQIAWDALGLGSTLQFK